MSFLVWAFLAAQLALAARVAARMAATARGIPIERCAQDGSSRSVTILVPVLDEERRLGPCLDALRAQGGDVREILVVDGGSRDATRAVILAAASRDTRIRLVDAAPVPAGWNGKAWNLASGLRVCDAASRLILTVDADVRANPGLVAALVCHARKTGLDAFSVATRQHVPDAASALLHPSMLTTLVYRFGIPGRAARSLGRVQANGQCFVAARELLVRTGAIDKARDSRCEDVTIARVLAASGTAVGFYESADLVKTQMYENWRETLNWLRSLTMLDRYSGAGGWIGLLEVLLVQALPPFVAGVLLLFGSGSPLERAALAVQVGLVVMRVATLIGTRRAYDAPPATYWLSPLVDLPVAVLLLASALRRRHTWRGRALVPMEAR
jgi:dolichol-phosphate mannosyltransferase